MIPPPPPPKTASLVHLLELLAVYVKLDEESEVAVGVSCHLHEGGREARRAGG